MDSKLCRACGQLKPKCEFSAKNAAKDGLQYNCRPCAKAHLCAWRKENKHLVDAAADRRRDSGKSALHAAVYRKRNPEKIAAYRVKRAIVLKRPRRQRMSPEDRKRTKREWKAANRLSSRASKHKNRAKRFAADGCHSKAELSALLVMQQGKCAVCKCCLANGYEVDHIQPIARGGSNAITNIQMLCRPCNRAKSSKNPIHFMQQQGFLL